MNILNLPAWLVLAIKEADHDYHITAQVSNPPSYCPHCGAVANLQGYGGKEQLYLDLPIQMKRVGILVRRKRYRCKECGRTFLEVLPDMDEDHLMTRRLVEYIEEQSLNRTFTDVADLVGVDEKTVRLIFRDYVKVLEAKRKFVTPPTLGIDELHLAGKARCVITNVEERTIVDMLKDRNQETVLKYLSGLPEGHRVEVVAMDMWRPYRQAVEAVLPNATIVVDKFHIQRMGNDALETIRKQLRASLSDKRRRTLKKDRFILLRRKRDLKEQDLVILESWTHNFPTLGAAYELKESFFDIWDEDDRQAAEARYDLWQADIPLELADQFEPIVTAMKNWREPIFAYFDTGLTNAYTEAMNGLIRVIDRAGRGYSFEALRAKILFSAGLHKIQRPSIRKARKGEPPIVLQVPSVNLGVDISTLTKTLKDGSFDDLSTH